MYTGIATDMYIHECSLATYVCFFLEVAQAEGYNHHSIPLCNVSQQSNKVFKGITYYYFHYYQQSLHTTLLQTSSLLHNGSFIVCVFLYMTIFFLLFLYA